MKACDHEKTLEEYALAFERGDEKALSFFYQKFHPALAFYADRLLDNRSIAEEIASEALIKIWRVHFKLSNYYAIRSYLYKTVHRDCLRTSKKEFKIASIQKDASRTNQLVDTPFDNLVRTETYRIIHTALKDLAPGSRKVLTMHYLDGKTTGEIAKELQLSPSTIKTQKTKGLQALRKIVLRPISILIFILFKILLFS